MNCYFGSTLIFMGVIHSSCANGKTQLSLGHRPRGRMKEK
jgi:hypothetical protein